MNDLDGADQMFFTKISIAGKNTSVLSYRFHLTDLEVFDASTYKNSFLFFQFFIAQYVIVLPPLWPTQKLLVAN